MIKKSHYLQVVTHGMDTNRMVTRTMDYNFEKINRRVESRKVQTFHTGDKTMSIPLRNLSSSMDVRNQKTEKDAESNNNIFI